MLLDMESQRCSLDSLCRRYKCLSEDAVEWLGACLVRSDGLAASKMLVPTVWVDTSKEAVDANRILLKHMHLYAKGQQGRGQPDSAQTFQPQLVQKKNLNSNSRRAGCNRAMPTKMRQPAGSERGPRSIQLGWAKRWPEQQVANHCRAVWREEGPCKHLAHRTERGG